MQNVVESVVSLINDVPTVACYAKMPYGKLSARQLVSGG